MTNCKICVSKQQKINDDDDAPILISVSTYPIYQLVKVWNVCIRSQWLFRDIDNGGFRSIVCLHSS